MRRAGENAAPKRVQGGWTEEDWDFTRALWLAGESAGNIARLLAARGRPNTRNAVIGKLHRMKLIKSGRETPAAPPAKGLSIAAGSVAARRRGRAVNPKGRAHPEASETWPDSWTEPPPLNLKGVRLAAIGDAFLAAGQQPVGCRFIDGGPSPARSDDPEDGGWRYCQREPAAGGVYCAAHAALCRGRPERADGGADSGGVVRTRGAVDRAALIRAFVVAAAGSLAEIAEAVRKRFGVHYSTRQIAGLKAWSKRAARRAA